MANQVVITITYVLPSTLATYGKTPDVAKLQVKLQKAWEIVLNDTCNVTVHPVE